MQSQRNRMMVLSAAALAVIATPAAVFADHDHDYKDQLSSQIKKLERAADELHNVYAKDLDNRRPRGGFSHERELLETICELRDDTSDLGRELRYDKPLFSLDSKVHHVGDVLEDVLRQSSRARLSDCMRDALSDTRNAYKYFNSSYVKLAAYESQRNRSYGNDRGYGNSNGRGYDNDHKHDGGFSRGNDYGRGSGGIDRRDDDHRFDSRSNPPRAQKISIYGGQVYSNQNGRYRN